MEIQKEYVTENFTIEEVSCPCGECDLKVDSMHLFKIQTLRYIIGKKFRINSWYRCLTYNRTLEDSSDKSQHVLARATDISTRGWSDDEVMRLITTAYLLGFKGIGVYPTFLHLDSRDGPFEYWVRT